MLDGTESYPIGSRVLVRDSEWLVKDYKLVQRGGGILTCEGISGLVRGKMCRFYTYFEDKIKLLLPEETELVIDQSPDYIDTKLYIESLFRTSPVTEADKIFVAHKAAIDPLPYQFDPALQALKQPKARILIADAVGIGKTMEAGILVSELIARGRGRRILVVAVKSVLSQFQQEFWNRFSIPLTLMDSVSINRIKRRIPANHNPFHYFDRAIISIDTLKQSGAYREYLRKAYWDIIIVDEAHNVANRSSRSQRAELAELLSDRSDSMIMLSATPHDGRAESFASLLNILDPTAIANPSSYTVEDYASKGLVIRRFKKDIQNQINEKFPQRCIERIDVEASQEEMAVYKGIEDFSSPATDDKQAVGARLFSTVMLKGMFSSPAALVSIVKNRIKRLRDNRGKLGDSDEAREEIDKAIEKLEKIKTLAQEIKPDSFTKLQKLAGILKAGKSKENKTTTKGSSQEKEASVAIETGAGEIWTDLNLNDSNDRVVVFTESVVTLDYLRDNLPKLAGLKGNGTGKDTEYLVLSGKMKDVEIEEVVGKFNSADSKVRVLLCSDVASEGINLHYFSHRLIHFDIPWSLMTFQQRNGRIDRYGQKKQPLILYMQTVGEDAAPKETRNQGEDKPDEKLNKMDNFIWVLNKLQEKDKQAQENLTDPAEFLLSEKEQESSTEAEGEGHIDEFFARMLGNDNDSEDKEDLAGESSAKKVGFDDEKGLLATVMGAREFEKSQAKRESLFKSDFQFLEEVVRRIDQRENATGNSSLEVIEGSREFILNAPTDLRYSLRNLPQEVLPHDFRFHFATDPKVVQEKMKEAKSIGIGNASVQLLWKLHPVIAWAEHRALTVFGRHCAPCIGLSTLETGEKWFLLLGGFPNKRGFSPVHEWVAVCEKNGEHTVHTLSDFMERTRLAERLLNDGTSIKPEDIASSLKKAVELAELKLKECKCKFEETSKNELEEHQEELGELKKKHEEQVEKSLTKRFSNTGQKKKKVAPDADIGSADTAKATSGGNGGKVPEEGKSSSKTGKRSALLDRKLNEIKGHFDAAERYLIETATLEDRPYIQLAGVFAGKAEQ